MLPISVPGTFRIIAHRGASAYAPENTAAAFRLAYEMGVSEVELDTQLTTDKQVALCHDTILARYYHEDRVVEEMAWPDLAALDMGSWFSPYLYSQERMLTLTQLFEEFGRRFTYHIEIKGRAAALPAAVYDCIRRFDLVSSCIVTSFDYESLIVMRALAPEMRLGWLVKAIEPVVLAKAKDLALSQLCPQAAVVTSDMVALARTAAPEIRAWGLVGETVSGQGSEVVNLIHRVLAAGCDGMTINWPDWVTHSPARRMEKSCS